MMRIWSLIFCWCFLQFANAEAVEGVCYVSEDDKTLIDMLVGGYLRHQTLYTGGMHFKGLDSVSGSTLMFLALNGDWASARNISKRLDKRVHFFSRKLDTSLLYFRKEPIDSYVSAMDKTLSALNSLVDNEYNSQTPEAFATSFYQATFNLDLFTAPGKPLNWWLERDFPNALGHFQYATWKASQKVPLVDWLQFIVSSSVKSELINWSFSESAEKREEFADLEAYASSRWNETQSYAWLLALSEVVDAESAGAGLVLQEAIEIQNRIRDCSATQEQLLTYSLMLTNVTRLQVARAVEPSFLGFSGLMFERIKTKVRDRYSKYLFVRKSHQEYQKFFALRKSNPVLEDLRKELFFGEEVGNILKFNGRLWLSDNQKRYISLLPLSKQKTLLGHPNLSNKDNFDLTGTVFLKSWLKDDLGDSALLRSLQELYPEANQEIDLILNVANKDIRRALVFKFVLKHPGLSYYLPVDLFYSNGRFNIKQFDRYNPNDGSWWCSTDVDKKARYWANKMALDFGFAGSDPYLSAGRWGASFHNPGQKRDYLRFRRVLKDMDLHDKVQAKILKAMNVESLMRFEDWQRFSELPPAPIYFWKKLERLKLNSELDDTLIDELESLVLRAATRTCYGFEGILEVRRALRASIAPRYELRRE